MIKLMHLKLPRFLCYLVRNPHCPTVLSDKTEGLVTHLLDDMVCDSFHGQLPHQCCKLPDSYFMGTGGKAARAWTHLHLVPRFKNDCSYTSTPPIRLMSCTRTTLPYPRGFTSSERTRKFAAIATVLQYLMLRTLLCYVRLRRSSCLPSEQLYWH